MIVTIDGPAGAGKSTAARALAARLGFDYLDTGAMYRAVTLAALRAELDPEDREAVARLAEKLKIELPPGRVFMDGEDVTTAVRTAAVTAASGAIADNPAVRTRLVQLQREIAEGRNVVCEGRDQGTVVFPEAGCKFFLVADPDERARRRQREMASRGESVPWDELRRAQDERDRRDARRTMAPMVPAADAVLLDSTALDIPAMVGTMEREIRRRMAGGGSPPP